jgi:hypothetical protein
MLLSGNFEAVSASIKIWTIDTFEAITDNRRVAHVASRAMTNSVRWGRRTRAICCSITTNWGSITLPAFTENRMNEHSSGRFNVEKFMERVVHLRSTCLDAGRA